MSTVRLGVLSRTEVDLGSAKYRPRNRGLGGRESLVRQSDPPFYGSPDFRIIVEGGSGSRNQIKNPKNEWRIKIKDQVHLCFGIFLLTLVDRLHVMTTGGTFHIRGQKALSKKFFMKCSNSPVRLHKSMPENNETSCRPRIYIWHTNFQRLGILGEKKICPWNSSPFWGWPISWLAVALSGMNS